MAEHRGTVLVVDDEPDVRDVVCSYLLRDGYQTLEAGDGTQARILLEQHRPDLAILDVMLPGTDGLELCRLARERYGVAVIMLSARGEETDRIVGLELGADDYLVKPFSPRELVARVRSVLRRASAQTGNPDDAPAPLVFGALSIDPRSRDVLRGDTTIRLTAREFDLLYFLARHPRQVFSRDQLMDGVWGYLAARDTGTVTVHMRRLREKVEPDPAQPRWLETVWGVGYRFAP